MAQDGFKWLQLNYKAVATKPTVIRRYDVHVFSTAASVFFFLSELCCFHGLVSFHNLSLGDLDLLARPTASVGLELPCVKGQPRSLSLFFFDTHKAPPPRNLAVTETMCVGAPSRRTHLSQPGVQIFPAMALPATPLLLFSPFSH